ncbi:hypothetical protein Tco_1531206 [Tanacetum coccineum]
MDHDNQEELYEMLTKSRKRRQDDQDPPLPPRKDSDQSKKRSSILMPLLHKSLKPIDDVPIPDDVHISDFEDIDTAHLPKIKTRPDWLKPNNWANAFATSYKDPEVNKLLQKIGDMGLFIKWYCRQIRKSKLSKADLEGLSYKVFRAFHSNNISLQFQMEECHMLLTDQIDLVNLKGHRVVPDVGKPLPLGGSKERRSALSISKLKAANYPDFGLEELVPSMWIEIRSHMRILSVVSLKTISRYSYTYLKEIVLRRVDYIEYKISESDFKNLHPNDFEDLNIVIRKRVEDLQLGIESYQTKLNLTEPNWDASDFIYREDYTIISKLRAIIYRDRND